MSGPSDPCGRIMPCFRSPKMDFNRRTTWRQLEQAVITEGISRLQESQRNVDLINYRYKKDIEKFHEQQSATSTNSYDSVEDARSGYEKASSGSDEETEAFDQWLSLCSTTDQARVAYNITSNSVREDKAFRRWLELCLTPDEARVAYNKTSNSEREEWARERIRELGGEI